MAHPKKPVPPVTHATWGHGHVFVNTKVSVKSAYTGAERSAALRSNRTHHQCWLESYHEHSSGTWVCRRAVFTNASLFTNRGGCIIILECQRGHAVYKQGLAHVQCCHVLVQDDVALRIFEADRVCQCPVANEHHRHHRQDRQRHVPLQCPLNAAFISDMFKHG
jgi:hypothetical protein